MMEVQVNSTGGGVGHSQGRRPHQPHRLKSRPQGPYHIQSRSRFLVHITQVETQYTVGNFLPVGHCNGAAVKKGAAP